MQRSSYGVPLGTAPHRAGHAHFWHRAVSRQRFLQSAAGVTGAALGAGLWPPTLAAAQGTGPKPIPGGIQPFGPGTETFHIILPDHGTEPSTITDLNGVVGLAHVMGTGTGTDTTTGKTMPLLMDYDVRFMQGAYVGTDGARHSGTFTFI
ncbi:MAG TPA: hypothetical protein VGP33_13820 [Chloroflexota bacterium]|jgi:phospholipase C|nr:hypothetical protein [Chloroflexota bacterium]